jgi:CheY-like chemotaxis protein
MKRALIIEDNENNMELITFILEAYGYKTIKAETGYKGFDLAIKEKPDFIILDIQLPDILGTVVLDLIRQSEIKHTIPIIAMTSFAMAGDREKLLSQGCDGYIEKPIDPEIVVQQIEDVLGEFYANINS